jgi:raffinose/stachyose/melibiose transport system substrate-binding protein
LDGTLPLVARPSRRRRSASLAALLTALVVVATACGGGTASPSQASSAPSAPAASTGGGSSASTAAASPSVAAIAPATIDLWLGGTLTTSTPGTPYNTWVQHVIDRFKAAFPGSDVKVSLLPPDNSQLAAQVQAAFASKKVPDVMLLYSGAYTTVYAGGLLQLNDLVNATPGFYDSLSGWDGSCINFDCQGGKGQIVAVPSDNFAFYLWYRKDILAKAGITEPAKTWSEMIEQCDKLVAAGITPWVYGDRDGYTTSNMMTTQITSFFDPGDVQKVLDGTLKYTDKKFLDAYASIEQLKAHKCVSDTSSTREQLDAANDLLTGKVAYMEGAPGYLPTFDPIKDKIGIAWIPYAGSGPLSKGLSTFSNGDWVIPKDAAHKELAWEFIKLTVDQQAQSDSEWVSLVGTPPANKAAAAAIVNPLVKYMAEQDQNTSMPVLDSVMPNPVALVWYRELQQAFAGKISIQDALAAVQQAQDQQAP